MQYCEIGEFYYAPFITGKWNMEYTWTIKERDLE